MELSAVSLSYWAFWGYSCYIKLIVHIDIILIFVYLFLFLVGTAFLCSVLVAPVKNEQGTTVMYIINHEDVTWSPNKDEVALQSMTCCSLFIISFVVEVCVGIISML